MKCMKRNKQTFYYAKYVSDKPITDEWGNLTSEHLSVYDKPVECKGNISAAKGETQTRQFGELEKYDRVIVLGDTDMDEHSILWIESMPVINDDGTTDTPHDYVVTKIARSLNCVSVAVEKVSVSNG